MPIPDFETARHLYVDKGMTMREICQACNVSVNCAGRVSQILKKGGVTARPKSEPTRMSSKLAEMEKEEQEEEEAPKTEKKGRRKQAKQESKATMGVTQKGDNAKVLRHNLVMIDWHQPDMNNPKAVDKRIKEYFALCVRQDMSPTLPGLALAFKVSRFTLSRYANGLDGIRQDVAMLLYQAVCVLDADSTQKMVRGMVHPKSGEFIMKNTLGYKDESTVVQERVEKKPSAEQIQEKYKHLLED